MRTTLIRRPYVAGPAFAQPWGEFIERCFGDMCAPRQETSWNPAVDILEDENGLRVVADLPGVAPENIKVAVEENTLKIEGHRKEEKEGEEGKTHWTERFTGSFSRSLRLPALVDAAAISAKYNQGVLEIACPLRPEAKPREIEVQAE